MAADPKISIIIPTHNMAQYLDQTLESWTSQTLKEIEVILIDDASTDGSRAILEKWEQADDRISVYAFAENKSAWTARKLGIESARGEYIMFADADDAIVPDACEMLYQEMKREPADILHFGTEIINVNHLPENQLSHIRRLVRPYMGTLKGKDVLLKCFQDGAYGFSLWNKIYSARVCKRAMEGQEDAVLPRGQDKLLYFLIAYYARSYRGLKGKALYQYYFGRGGTGSATMSAAQYIRYCSLSLVAEKLKQFLISQNVYDDLQKVEGKFRQELLADCVGKWIYRVVEADKAICFDALVKAWDISEVMGYLAANGEIDHYALAKQLMKAESLKFSPRAIKTIAAYYIRISNGGVQRVLCALCALWVRMGYSVIVLTDEPKTEKDYPLPENVKRVQVPDFIRSTGDKYAERGKALNRIIQENHIDAVVYHAWQLELMLWDELVIKASGAAFIAHCHNVFSVELLSPWKGQKNLTAPYLLADAVVTLSEVDRRYWSHFNPNVFVVINPFTDSDAVWDVSKCDNHELLWLGRLSPEKRPQDAVQIFRLALNEVPDARLHIVGSSADGKYEKELGHLIAELELGENVVLHGFQKNVRPYYHDSSVFIMTSQYEGYPLTLQESMMAGVPVVMYELPFLTLVQNNPGIIAVKQDGVQEAAQSVVELLKNDELRKQKGCEARAYIDSLRAYDFEDTWTAIFRSTSQPHIQTVDHDECTMLETLLLHNDIGQNRFGDDALYVGRKMVRTAIKLTKLKDCIHDNGVMYTIKKVIAKIKNR